jgi:Domain of unknown function (DUF4833)
MHIFCMTLLTLLLLPLPGWSKEVSLFIIQRSKNANEVQYHLRVDDRCRIRSHHPVSAVWKLREDGAETTEPLKALEQLAYNALEQLAYGVARQRVEENGVEFRLRALEEKPLKATVTAHPQTGTCVASIQVEIDDHWVAVERVYVQTEEQHTRPKVTYIELVGTRLEGNPRPVMERIMP